MTFLPIVERELRVVSRRKATFWVRCGASIIALMVLLLTLGLIGAGGRNAGGSVFWFMAWCGAGGTVMAGAFLGADSISEERREGTLGFLFLTDLKNYDVVLGKFMGASLNAFYGLLAMFPILGITVLAGGVTGGEFWRAALALLNMLFFSTALALLVSARIKSATRPTMLALSLLVVVWLGGWLAFKNATTIGNNRVAAALLWTSMVSPAQAVSLASAASYLHQHADFWRSLAISHGAGWAFLGLSCWRLDASLDDGEKTFRRRKFRARSLLQESPIAWLADDSRAMRVGVWLVAGAGVLLVIVCNLTKEPAGLIPALSPIYFVLKLQFAVFVCRFFAEGRRSGALELLRTTPVGGSELISGQWAALRRVFAIPFCALVLADVVSGLAMAMTQRELTYAGYITYKAIVHTTDFLAIGWCGMWIALKSRNPNRAAWMTILLLVVLPSVVYCFPNILIDPILVALGSDKVRQHVANYLATGATKAAISGRWSEATPQSGRLRT